MLNYLTELYTDQKGRGRGSQDKCSHKVKEPENKNKIK